METNFTLNIGHFSSPGELNSGEIIGVSITVILLVMIFLVIIAVLVLKVSVARKTYFPTQPITQFSFLGRGDTLDNVLFIILSSQVSPSSLLREKTRPPAPRQETLASPDPGQAAHLEMNFTSVQVSSS